MSMAKFCVQLSRKEAEEASGYEGAALISIRDFIVPPPSLKRDAWYDVLMLRFDDVDCDDEALSMFNGTRYVPPMRSDAEKIFEFIRKHFERNIAVHCEQGISRSAAVCWFLAEQGWHYVASSKGLGRANQRLLNLIRREAVRSGW